MGIRVRWLMMVSLLAAACATAPKERVVSKPVVLASAMCPRPGVTVHSADPKGDRMFCSMEELVGSHVPRCVCRDEKQFMADREAAQQWIRNLEQGKCLSNGAGTCQN